jgi:hypothetical protein
VRAVAALVKVLRRQWVPFRVENWSSSANASNVVESGRLTLWVRILRDACCSVSQKTAMLLALSACSPYHPIAADTMVP